MNAEEREILKRVRKRAAAAAAAPVEAAAAALAPAAAAASAAAQDLERIADMTRNVVREFVPEAPFTVAKEGYITIPEQPPERVRLEAQVIAQLDEDSLMKLPVETLQEIQIEYKIAAKRLTRQGIVQAILKHFKKPEAAAEAAAAEEPILEKVMTEIDEKTIRDMRPDLLEDIIIDFKIRPKKYSREGMIQAILTHFKIEPEPAEDNSDIREYLGQLEVLENDESVDNPVVDIKREKELFKMKFPDLKKVAKSYGIRTDGTKNDMINEILEKEGLPRVINNADISDYDRLDIKNDAILYNRERPYKTYDELVELIKDFVRNPPAPKDRNTRKFYIDDKIEESLKARTRRMTGRGRRR
jgi:hypothetical protein